MIDERKKEAVKEEKRLKCRGMMRERDKQSCSLCHVHTACDGSARHRDRAKEAESATESEDELL